MVEYYNDLDVKLGNEINGLDVLDDWESEEKEIRRAGNRRRVFSPSGGHAVLGAWAVLGRTKTSMWGLAGGPILVYSF